MGLPENVGGYALLASASAALGAGMLKLLEFMLKNKLDEATAIRLELREEIRLLKVELTTNEKLRKENQIECDRRIDELREALWTLKGEIAILRKA